MLRPCKDANSPATQPSLALASGCPYDTSQRDDRPRQRIKSAAGIGIAIQPEKSFDQIMASERQREIKRRRKRREKRLKAIVREARSHKKKKR
jgi:hypothetical protein